MFSIIITSTVSTGAMATVYAVRIEGSYVHAFDSIFTSLMLNGFDAMGHRKEHPDFQDVNKYGEESHSSAEGKVGLMEV